ncbi:MAG TPA: UMP kinase [Candidatus Kapabacteria bacterium]|nr:UMP kinase [Candidatus Kapabacteria bacterium]
MDTDTEGATPYCKRVVLKLSGEALKGDRAYGISPSIINNIAGEIRQVHDRGVQIALVIGGGNFFRGIEADQLGIERTSADYMGMLATIINGVALQNALEKKELPVRLVSALEIKEVAEPFIAKKACHHLSRGRVVIFAAGTGNPYFTTDTAAALRAIEIGADLFLKGTMVDGAYADDPKKVKNLVKFDRISYDDVIARELKVMDSTAVTLCKANNLHIKIFDMTQKGNIIRAITDRNLGTSITSIASVKTIHGDV